MRKIFLYLYLIVIIFTFNISYNISYGYEKIDNLYDLFNRLNQNKKIHNYYNKIWNNYTQYIGENYINNEQCVFLKKIKLQNKSKKEIIDLFYNNVKYYIGCNIYENSNKQKINFINTKSAKYRIYNITAGLKKIPKVIKPYTIYSVYNFLFKNDKKSYVDGYALIYNPKTKKIEDKKVYGGGLCGVSTVLYQAILNLKKIKVLERFPHSQFFLMYYNKYGQDSTIFGSGGKIYKDLKFISYYNSNIYVETFTNRKKGKYGNFNYGIKLYSFEPLQKGYIINKKIGNKCFENDIYFTEYTKKIKSCYEDIFY